jgi:hypothetical protein
VQKILGSLPRARPAHIHTENKMRQSRRGFTMWHYQLIFRLYSSSSYVYPFSITCLFFFSFFFGVFIFLKKKKTVNLGRRTSDVFYLSCLVKKKKKKRRIFLVVDHVVVLRVVRVPHPREEKKLLIIQRPKRWESHDAGTCLRSPS